MPASETVSDLARRWAERRASSRGERTVDSARALGVSEAELLASRCGDGVTRLSGSWTAILAELGEVGPVMALTRNPSVVIETDGRYRNVEDFGTMGQVLDEGIDLRLFLHRWAAGFAVTGGEAVGLKPGVQFFDRAGSAVHKVFLRPASDRAAFDRLVTRWTAEDQSPEHAVAPAAAPEAERPDTEVDAAALRTDWEAMQDTHEFFALLRTHGITRTQALRLVGRELAYRVGTGSLRAALERARDDALPFMVFVGNPGCIQIHTGPVRRLVEAGAWYNVMDPGFNLHVREGDVHAAWVVRKPTRDGIVTALELYDGAGEQVALLCGKRKPGEVESEGWRAVVAALPAA